MTPNSFEFRIQRIPIFKLYLRIELMLSVRTNNL